MKKRFAASAMILAMSAATVLSPLTAFAEAEEQELNIAIFQGGYGDAYWNQMVELFEASHEGVKVNMTISPTIGDIIRPQIVAGNAPDFICLNDGAEDGVILSLIKEHALLNLDDVFDGENYAGTGTLRDDITDGLSGDREAVILYGLGFPEFDDALDYSTIKWNNNGLRTNKNDACTVDNFKTDLNGKDLIVIEEHGCTYGDEPLIVTEDEYDPESGEYQEDLDAERLSILITDEGAQYCLTPSFFEYYYSGGKLANSFVWIGSCYGASNSRLVDAFVNTGANAVVGHSDSVYTAYDYNMLNTVVDKMISGESSSEAFQEARDYWGQNDEQFAIRYMEVDTKEEAPASYPSLTGDIRWE